MAGTFTHWMVVEEVLDRNNGLPQKHPYFSTILGLNHFVCLGAVGPDYPYLTELLANYLKIHSWADRMHYENSGDFVRNGIKNLLALEGDAFNTCLAWLCGFATHLVTDSVIHPVVQAIVGPYIFKSGPVAGKGRKGKLPGVRAPARWGILGNALRSRGRPEDHGRPELPPGSR
jgi:hypothetical protein